MPKRFFEPTESCAQLPPAKKAKTENEPSQTELVDLPNEVLSYLFEFVPPKNMGNLRKVSKSLKNLIDSKHGPRLEKLNNYLDLFPDHKEKTALTYPDYLKILDENKEIFLEKQFSEIQTVQKNLTDCRAWSNVPSELKDEILKIEEKDINYKEAKKREALLDAAHFKIIGPRINLQSRFLRLDYLNLTRLPKTLFTHNALQAFWQALETLHLNNNKLTTLPDEMGRLQSLRELSICDNLLTTLPVTIALLQKLTLLFLNNNLLRSIPPEIISLQALRELTLNNNQLTMLLDEMDELKALELLTVSNNQLTILPAKMDGFLALRELILYNNLLTTLPDNITELPELNRISVNNNQLTPEVLEKLKQRFGASFVKRTLATQTDPNIAQAEDLSNRNSPRP